MRDLSSNISVASSLAPAARTATANGTGVDLRGFGGAAVLINLGTFAGTTPTATLRVEESNDDSTYTAVAAADLVGGTIAGIDTTNDEGVIERSYIGAMRYIRVALTAIAGTSASLPSSAEIVRSHPAQAPA